MAMRDLRLIRDYGFTVRYNATTNQTELLVGGDYLVATFSGEHDVEYCCLGSGNVEGYMDSREWDAVLCCQDDRTFNGYPLKSIILYVQSRSWSATPKHYKGAQQLYEYEPKRYYIEIYDE